MVVFIASSDVEVAVGALEVAVMRRQWQLTTGSRLLCTHVHGIGREKTMQKSKKLIRCFEHVAKTCWVISNYNNNKN